MPLYRCTITKHEAIRYLVIRNIRNLIIKLYQFIYSFINGSASLNYTNNVHKQKQNVIKITKQKWMENIC
jgi:hypothetical protein